jgi:hypothetical protein
MPRFRLWLILAAAGVVLCPTQEVQACACCDGWTNRTVIGWSKSGKSVLTGSDGNLGCESFNRLGVLRVGKRGAKRTYELPARKAKQPTKRHRATRFFPLPARQLDPGLVRVRTKVVRIKLNSGFAVPLQSLNGAQRGERVTVELLQGGRWSKVWSRIVLPYTPSDPSGAQPEEDLHQVPLRVELWPAPDKQHALLVLGGHETMPGIGHKSTSLHWVKLPATATVRLVASTGSALSFAVPAPARKRARSVLARAARRRNSAGMALHRKGKHNASADRFYQALRFDPAHTLARYNFACALARLGHSARALGILAELKKQGCKRCLEQLKAAASDPDLASLRASPRFKALTGG